MQQITVWVSHKIAKQLQKASDKFDIPVKYIAGYVLVCGMRDMCYIPERDDPEDGDQEVAIIACPPLQGTDPTYEINMTKLRHDIRIAATEGRTTLKNVMTKAMKHDVMMDTVRDIKIAMKHHGRIQ